MSLEKNSAIEENNAIAKRSDISQEDALKKGQDNLKKIDAIRQAERIDGIKQELLKVGILDNKNETTSFLFCDKQGNKDLMKIDISSQTIEFQGKKIQIQLPKGAKISNINFGEDKVSIEGRVGFFSGGGSAPYEDLISAVDEVLEKGNHILMAGNEKIGLKIV